MNDAKQKATKLARLLYNKIENSDVEWCDLNKEFQEFLIADVLRELNLESLTEDSLMLDFMDKRTGMFEHFKFHHSNAAMQKNWRSAIRTAMQQEQEKK